MHAGGKNKNLIFSPFRFMHPYLFVLTTFVLLLASGACKPRQVIYSNPGESAYRKKSNADTLWYLKYRVPDCDSALAFMKQQIVPVRS